MVHTLRSPRVLRKGLVDPVGELHEGVPRVAPERHRGGAGVILLTLELDHEVARADDAGDGSDALSLVLEPRSLLDVRFGVPGVATRLAAHDRNPFEPGLANGLAQGLPVVVGEIPSRLRRQLATEREAPEAGEEGALLVDPGCDVHREMARRFALREGPRHLEAVDDPHRAVEPATPRLGVRVRAEEDGRPGVARAAEHGADPVDMRFESRLAHPLAEPVARFDVDRGQRLPDDADPAGAEFAEPPQIREKAVRIDRDGGGARRRVHFRSCIAILVNSLCPRVAPCQFAGVPDGDSARSRQVEWSRSRADRSAGRSALRRRTLPAGAGRCRCRVAGPRGPASAR